MAKEPIKLNCSISFDDEWLQEECHWTYDRIFNITWKISSGDITKSGEIIPGEIYELKEFYYRITPTTSDYTAPTDTSKYTRIYSSNENLSTKTTIIGEQGGQRKLERFDYRIRLSTLSEEELLRVRNSEGWVTVTALVVVKEKDTGKIYRASDVYDYYLEFPPEEVEEVKTSLVISRPGELLCTWDKSKLFGEDSGKVAESDSIDGYVVELKYQPRYTEGFISIGDLKLETLEGRTYLVRAPKEEISEGADFYNEDLRTEVYLEGGDSTHFYFNPKLGLGLKGGDKYKFIISPYSHYEGALLGNTGIESDDDEVANGVVHVKTANGWIEGQVWVKTADGWKEAEAVYTKTEDGWREST